MLLRLLAMLFHFHINHASRTGPCICVLLLCTFVHEKKKRIIERTLEYVLFSKVLPPEMPQFFGRYSKYFYVKMQYQTNVSKLINWRFKQYWRC